MILAGIDTSCDDTCVATVEDGRILKSNVVSSQVDVHHIYGGVVPELASREHVSNIITVFRESLREASITNRDIDAIAVTVGPGLVGALLVGIYFSKSFGYARHIPLIGVNHLEGHILSIFLEEDVPDFPFVALTVSGGHTNMYHVKGFGHYKVLGRTLDDAAGEAFDKVAKLLNLGYPGGRVIEELALHGRPDAVEFPRAYLSKDSLDFSFSGLKTAVALYVRRWRGQGKDKKGEITVSDIAASFQAAVTDILVDKLMAAASMVGVKSVMMAGGVARNNYMRYRLKAEAFEKGMKLHIPRPELCTDNGAMIAVAGYHKLMRGCKDGLGLDARSRYPPEDI